MWRERRRVGDGRSGLGAALAFAAMSPAPPLKAQTTTTAQIKAEVVTPAAVGVTAASEWLLSESPGVLALRIPGAAPAGAVELAVGPSNTSGAAGSNPGAAAMQRLIAQMTAAIGSGGGAGLQASGTVTNGTLNGHGMQMVMTTTGSGGNGVTTAVITFD